MSGDYDPQEIEEKWQEKWRESDIFRPEEETDKKKFYTLEMFPYPSGERLHVGHLRNYLPTDALARYKRMQGFNVFYPIGFDAFGLPAENAAIQKGVHPKESTLENIEIMKGQYKRLGQSYDWDSLVISCLPEYYKWNQWLFLQLFDEDLAYRSEAPSNWCPSCKTVLANEQVEDGKCWRCDSEVEVRHLEQWFLKITDYADELLSGLEEIDWPKDVKAMQRNWIGRSEGASVDFELKGTDHTISVFTTRPDTLFGCTFLAFAPEHPLVMDLVGGTDREEEVREFIDEVVIRERREREETEKRGIDLGIRAVNPVNGEEIPVYVANFVLMEYGTGAIMAVPAHDQRDLEFAKKYDIPVVQVIQPEEDTEGAYEGEGKLVNSGDFSGLDSEEAHEEITSWLEEEGKGRSDVQYKLRDWLISRQRYWGTPIPIVYCDECGTVPVPEEDLPVELPEEVDFTGEGNPLETSESFVEAECPQCGGEAERETDTMDTFVDSSWYFLRYLSPAADEIFETRKADYWLPVDMYIGGKEHAVTHLLYSRFVTKVLRDMGEHGIDEPFQKLINQGMILREGVKMSKSKGNAVSPDDLFEEYGVDALRLYELGVAQLETAIEWDDEGVPSMHSFLERFWNMFGKKAGDSMLKEEYIRSSLNRLIENVTEDLDDFNYPDAINAIIDFTGELDDYREHVTEETYEESLEKLTLLLTPFAPHICEELWSRNHDGFANVADWPEVGEVDRDPLIGEEIIHTVFGDVDEIKELTGMEEPEKITLFVAPDWKREVYEGVRDGKEVSDFMEDEELKQYGDTLVSYAQSLEKKKYELEDYVMGEDAEFGYLEKNEEFLEENLGTEVEVVRSIDSDHEKARSADVHKPGILLE